MNFIKRAWLNVTAKKGRTLLLTAVTSAILIFVLAGLTLQSAALKAAENAKKSMGSTVTLAANRENSMSKSSTSDKKPDPSSFTVTPVKLSAAKKIAQLDNVKNYNILSSTSAGAESFEPISSSDSSSDSSSSTSVMTQGQDSANESGAGESGGKQMPAGMTAQGDLSVSGVLNTATLSDFTGSTSKITSGRGIKASDAGTNNVVIEKTLASANSLKVGDKITISNPTDTATTYELTIVGIYKTTTQSDSRGMSFNFMNPSNSIYTSYTFANTLKGTDYTDTADSITYTLSDPDKTTAFVNAAKKTGISTTKFSLETNDATYQQMIEPLNNVKSFAEKIVWLVSIAGVIILALIVMLMIRERRYEIGVLLSLGEKRAKVVAQFFSEMLVVLVISFAIAGVSGKYVGNVVGQQLLDQQTEQTSSTSSTTGTQKGGPGGENSGGGGPMGNISKMGASSTADAKKIESLDITLGLADLAKLGGFGLIITFLSILIASFGILRLQPKKILIS